MIEITNVHASGRRSGWWKLIAGVNPKGVGARAFKGTFLSEGEHVLPPGALLLQVFPGGTAVSKIEHVELWQVTTAGTRIRLGGRMNWKLDLERVKERARRALLAPAPQPVFREVTPEDNEHPMLPYLRKLAPAVVVKPSWSPSDDEPGRWDPAWGDRDDFDLYDFDVTAMVIVEGRAVSETASLGGDYEKAGAKPDMDCHGYFPQKVEEALAELKSVLTVTFPHRVEMLLDQILAAREFCDQWLQERYEAHITKEHGPKPPEAQQVPG